MARRSSFDILTIQTNNTALIWKDVHGIAPDNAAKKLDIAMLDWQSELTKRLKIFIKNSKFLKPLIFQGISPVQCSVFMYFPLFLPL